MHGSCSLIPRPRGRRERPGNEAMAVGANRPLACLVVVSQAIQPTSTQDRRSGECSAIATLNAVHTLL